MIKKIFLALLLVAIAVIVFSVLRGGHRTITNYPPTGRMIVAFGDSLVEGVGSEGGGGFVAMLSKRLGLPITNLGKSGDTTAAGLTRLDDAIARDPDIVILLLGGNDYLRRVPKTETFSNLSRIIDRLHAEGAIVVLLGVRGGVLGDGFEKDFDRLAKEKKTAFVSDVLDDVIDDRSLMSDQIHPNDKGYEKIADRIESELRSILD